jgi:transposase InsO family protein
MRFRFIEEHRGAFPIDRLCQVLNVSSRGLRAFRNRPASRRQRTDMVVLAHIKEQSRLSLGSYGRPRMTEELKEVGIDVGHRRVGRLMRENGISVERTRKFKVEEGQEMIRGIISPTTHRQRSYVQHRPEPAGSRLQSRSAEPEMGWRHKLHLDPRRLAVSGGDPGPSFTARDRLGRQQSHEA